MLELQHTRLPHRETEILTGHASLMMLHSTVHI